MKRPHAMRRLAVGAILLALCAACETSPTPSPSSPATSSSGAGSVTLPTRPIELVVDAPRDSDADAFARLLQGTIEKHALSPQPIQVVDRDGNDGADAYTSVASRSGDMHTLLVAYGNSFLLTAITKKLAPPPTALTPIADLGADPVFLWVNEDSAWKTASDLLAAARQDPLAVAGAGSRGQDEALFRRIEDVGRTKPFAYAPQLSGAAAAAALAAHQTGTVATVNDGTDALRFYSSSPRRIRPLCAFLTDSPKSGPYQGVPTCAQQGLSIDDAAGLRGVVGAPGLTVAQQRFWTDLFKKVFDAPEWQQALTDDALLGDLREGADFAAILTRYDAQYRDTAQRNGWSP